MSVDCYENLARRFLREHASGKDSVNVEALTGVDVSGFVLAECARVSLGSVTGRITELRSLLRFLHLRGLTPMALATAVPAVAGWRDTAIPTLTATDVQALIASCLSAFDPAQRRLRWLRVGRHRPDGPD